MTQPSDNKPKPPKDESVTFTLDGRSLTSPTRKMSAGDLLRLGGLDPAGYDLTVIRPGQAPEKAYDDDRQVVIKDGDKFLSVRQSAQVA